MDPARMTVRGRKLKWRAYPRTSEFCALPDHANLGHAGKGAAPRSVSADTRYAKRGWGRGGPMFWPESSFMTQTMTNLHSY